MISQTKKILEILSNYEFHCVNEFIDTYCVDYRRRLVDLKRAGYVLESRKCEKHQHKGGSKEWILLGHVGEIKKPKLTNDELALGI